MHSRCIRTSSTSSFSLWHCASSWTKHSVLPWSWCWWEWSEAPWSTLKTELLEHLSQRVHALASSPVPAVDGERLFKIVISSFLKDDKCREISCVTVVKCWIFEPFLIYLHLFNRIVLTEENLQQRSKAERARRRRSMYYYYLFLLNN